MDTSYIGAIVLVAISVCKVFGIVVSPDAITGVVTGVIALVVAIHTKYSKNLTAFGSVKKA